MTATIREDAQHIVTSMGEALAPLRGSTLLLTGAAGFLGAHFLDTLAALNDEGGPPCRVLALDNFRSGIVDRIEHLRSRPDIRFLEHDVIQPFLPDLPVDWIIHAASIASPTFYRQFPLETIDVNVTGTRHMLELAGRGARSMLYLSSSEIYGDPDPGAIPTTEEYRGIVSCTGPRACYDESKRLAETLATTYFRLRGTPVKSARPFNVYGPGQRLDDRRIIPDLMRAAVQRQPLVLHSDGRATRSFCYVTDAVRGFLYVLLSDANGEAFNVGNDEEISIGRLAELMQHAAGPPELPIRLVPSGDKDYLTDNPQRRCPDLAKLKALAPWRPEVRTAEGLARTLRSYRE